MGLLDQPLPLAFEDRARTAPLVAYLREQLGLDEPAELLRFYGGRANLTYLLRAGDREMVVRRPPPGPLPPRAHDMEREYRVMTVLRPRLGVLPRTVLLCTDRSVIGVPFFVMERIQGFVLRDAWPDVPAGKESAAADDRRRLSQAFVDVLVRLHDIVPDEIGLADIGRPEGFVARQVAGWAERWQRAADNPASAADVFSRLGSQLPATRPAAVLHNDMKLDNLMLDPGDLSRIRAVFDWDMCTLGDPLVDLGIALAYWGQAEDDPAIHGGALPPTALRGFLTREQLAERYAAASGRDLESVWYYQAFGFMKIAVLLQQLIRVYERNNDQREQVAIFERRIPALWSAARDAISAA